MRGSIHTGKLIWGLILAPVLLLSCNKENKAEPQTALPEITVVFSPGGLGDRSYNDQVLRGIEVAANNIEEDYYLSFFSPEDMEEAEMLIEFWWLIKDEPGDEEGNIPRRLLVLGSQEYADMAREIVDMELLDNDLCIVAFEEADRGEEADQIHTFDFCMYGASWLAGRTAQDLGCKKPLVLLGNSSNTTTFDARDGFMDGYGPDAVTVDAFADDFTGYIMAPEAYQMMYDYDEQGYDFIYSISGGTNMGIYRYLRENPDCGIYTAGMDVDQSAYSTLIVGSMVKRIDLVLYEYLDKWVRGEELPMHRHFDLQDSYMDWVIPRRHSHLIPSMESRRGEAVKRENEYESK